ncbi:MAG TPA: hypothetical protein PLD02_13505, partial [Saprospiraceae bacterium]|nr:hypothetical protein [Saprospiraceae bacterium]
KQFTALALDLILLLILFTTLHLLFNFQFQKITGDIDSGHQYAWDFPNAFRVMLPDCLSSLDCF